MRQHPDLPPVLPIVSVSPAMALAPRTKRCESRVCYLQSNSCSPKNILTGLWDIIFRSKTLKYAPKFAPGRSGSASDRDWRFLTRTRVVVGGFQCTSGSACVEDAWMIGGYRRAPCGWLDYTASVFRWWHVAINWGKASPHSLW